MCSCKLYFALFIIISYNKLCLTQERDNKELVATVKSWGEKLGKELKQLATDVIQKSKIEASFQKTKVVSENGKKVVEDIAKTLRSMMKTKEKLLKKIVEKAEYLSFHRQESILFNSTFDYYNAVNITNTTTTPEFDEILHQAMIKRDEQFKCDEIMTKLHVEDDSTVSLTKLEESGCKAIPYIEQHEEFFRRLPLLYHPQFQSEVNLNYSVVKVGTSIYDRDDLILNDVKWSEALDLIFKSNYKEDPTLKWQFFAGTTGFMRHYPAIKWSEEQYDQSFDFRTRAWYLEAISSPKDVIILLDMSGSMWQYKWITGKFLVNNILDTLGDNDYVNIYIFNKYTYPLVNCFNFTLMQAHEENLRLLRESLDEHKPSKTGDLTKAFHMAFATLAKFREDEKKTHCNQMIMFVTDSVDLDYNPAELFKTYNRGDSLYTPVRVFTFLIGTGETDAKQMEWIACANMGYYVNVSKSSDIAEKVVKYLNVLSRPLNLNSETKPNPIWTGTYVDLADRRLSNWLWNKHEGNMQRDIFLEYSWKTYEQYNCIWTDDITTHFMLTTDHEYAKYRETRHYNYMTTVSLPAYDRRPERHHVLGIAGIDVPIDYIKKLTTPHRIGVNGYAFIMTNNGLVMLHPDHRKEFHNILKPTFNRVDMTEVELINDLNEPRDFNKSLLIVREEIVNQTTGDAIFDVKIHLDKMRRIMFAQRHYYYTKIEPFNLVIALSEKYGHNLIKYEEDKVHEITLDKTILNALKKTKNWSIHPEWIYCKYYGSSRIDFASPEEELMYFLTRLERNGWKWPEHCNPDLVNLLILDADATKWFEDDFKVYPHSTWDGILNKYQISLVFMATHSGLTRWKVGIENTSEEQYIKRHPNSIDEIWYRRSTEMNYDNAELFTYAAPFEKDFNASRHITVSHAFYRGDKTKRAPVAVAGFRIDQVILDAMFTRHTTKCGKQRCKYTCDSIELHCFILDNNAYILVSEEAENVGDFLGDVRPDIMSYMVEDGVFKQTRFFDYQGICYLDPPAPPAPKGRSFATKSRSFLSNIGGIVSWALTSLWCLVKDVFGKPKDNPCLKAITAEYNKRAIHKTLPTPCDRQMWLYTLARSSHAKTNVNMFTTPDCLWNYIVQPIVGSNLVLLVVNAPCASDTGEKYPFSPKPVELKYNLSMPCYIATKNDYTRRSYIKCINKHEKENKLNLNRKYCGNDWD